MEQRSQKVTGTYRFLRRKKALKEDVFQGDVIKEMLAKPWIDSGSADRNAEPMNGQHDRETKSDVHVAAVS